MKMEKLIEILELPTNPHEVPSEAELSDFERKCSALPSAYKKFITRYGTGCVDGFIWIYNPSSENAYLALGSQVVRQLEAIRAATSENSGFPFDVSEDGGELLPFGITDNGDFLLWRTTGSPDSWPIVVLDSRLGSYEVLALSLIEFLIQVLSRKLVVSVFPDDFPSTSPQFSPAPNPKQ